MDESSSVKLKIAIFSPYYVLESNFQAPPSLHTVGHACEKVVTQQSFVFRSRLKSMYIGIQQYVLCSTANY